VKLDQATLELLGYGEAWPSIIAIAYDLRARDLEARRLYAQATRVTKRSPFAPCPECGRVFDSRGSGKGWLRTFCSDRCRKRYHNRRKPVERLTTCQACGAPLEQPPARRADGRGNRPRRFCGPKCARKLKQKKTREQNSDSC
jgi:hypothetical protein